MSQRNHVFSHPILLHLQASEHHRKKMSSIVSLPNKPRKLHDKTNDMFVTMLALAYFLSPWMNSVSRETAKHRRSTLLQRPQLDFGPSRTWTTLSQSTILKHAESWIQWKFHFWIETKALFSCKFPRNQIVFWRCFRWSRRCRQQLCKMPFSLPKKMHHLANFQLKPGSEFPPPAFALLAQAFLVHNHHQLSPFHCKLLQLTRPLKNPLVGQLEFWLCLHLLVEQQLHSLLPMQLLLVKTFFKMLMLL